MSLRTLQWCYVCITTNFGRTNPHLSLTIEIVATVFFMYMVTVDIACRNIELLEYILVKLCIAVVHLINKGKKQVNDGSVTAAAFRESRQQEEIMCPILESSGNNHPFHDDSDNSVYKNIQ